MRDLKLNFALARRAVPSFRGERKREWTTGLPRAATKNRGDDAWLFEN
jgi:hypothetical protein